MAIRLRVDMAPLLVYVLERPRLYTRRGGIVCGVLAMFGEGAPESGGDR